MFKIALKINYRNACTAKLYMFIGIMRHIWDTAQILTDELAQNAISLSMKDSNSWHSYQDGIINEILNGIECFIATHTSYIQILVEVGLMGSIVLRVSLLIPYEARFSLRSSVLSAFSAVACSSLLRRILVLIPPNTAVAVSPDAFYLSYVVSPLMRTVSPI